MDRRYRENQFGDGSGAIKGRAQLQDRLVNQYLAQARRMNNQAQSYGGSTGRPGGVYGAEAAPTSRIVSSLRGVDQRDRNAIFDIAGAASVGSRGGFSASRGWKAEGLGVKPRPTT